MNKWKNIKIEGFSIEKVVGEYDLMSIGRLPFSKFKIKIYEKNDGTYKGCANVKLASYFEEDKWVEGYGESIDEALENTIDKFCVHLGDKSKQKFQFEDEFNWMSWREF